MKEMQNVWSNETFDQLTQKDIVTDASTSKPYFLENDNDENANICYLTFRRARFLTLFIYL